MAWSYSPSLPTDRDWIRFRIGDTLSQDQLLSNEEIDAMLAAAGGSKTLALVKVLEGLVARFARLVNRSQSDVSDQLAQRFAQYQQLLTQARAWTPTTGPVAGGISIAAKEAVFDDEDAPEPIIKRGEFDHP